MENLTKKLEKVENGQKNLLELIQEIYNQTDITVKIRSPEVNVHEEIDQVIDWLSKQEDKEKKYLDGILKASSEKLKSEYKAVFLGQYVKNKSLETDIETVLDLLGSEGGKKFISIIQNNNVSWDFWGEVGNVEHKNWLIWDEATLLKDNQKKLNVYSNYLPEMSNEPLSSVINLEWLIEYAANLSKEEGKQAEVQKALEIVKDPKVKLVSSTDFNATKIFKLNDLTLTPTFKKSFLDAYLQSGKKLSIDNNTALNLLGSEGGEQFVSIIENNRTCILKQIGFNGTKLEEVAHKRAYIFNNILSLKDLSDEQKLNACANYLKGMRKDPDGKVKMDLEWLVKYTGELSKKSEKNVELEKVLEIITSSDAELVDKFGVELDKALIIKEVLKLEDPAIVIKKLQERNFIQEQDIIPIANNLREALNSITPLTKGEEQANINCAMLSKILEALSLKEREGIEKGLKPYSQYLLYRYEISKEIKKTSPNKEKISERYFDLVDLQREIDLEQVKNSKEQEKTSKAEELKATSFIIQTNKSSFNDNLRDAKYTIIPGGEFDRFLSNSNNTKTLARLLEKSVVGNSLIKADVNFAKQIKEVCHPAVQEKLLRVFEKMDGRTVTREKFAGNLRLYVNDAFNMLGNTLFNSNIRSKNPGIEEFKTKIEGKINLLNTPPKKVKLSSTHYRDMIRKGKTPADRGTRFK